jgi:hypothetical protein
MLLAVWATPFGPGWQDKLIGLVIFLFKKNAEVWSLKGQNWYPFVFLLI